MGKIEKEIIKELGNEKVSNEIAVKLYEPHTNQLKIIKSPARFKVIRCGRRFGKTTFALNTLFISALLKENGTFWYISPTYKQSKQIAWRMLAEIYRKNSRKLFHKLNESYLSLQLHNGSVVELKGADNEDSLRGVGLDGVVLDEYAMIKPNVWEEIIQPTLADTKGWAIFISTPKGENHFHKLYCQAEKTPDWEAFHFTSYDNPLIDPKEIDRNRDSMSDDYFGQEYLADFKKFTGLVYKDFNRDIHVTEPFQIPLSWPRWRTIDAGLTNPFVCLWIAQAPDNKYYIYDEHYMPGQTTKYHAEMINNRSRGQIFRATFIDPAAAQQMMDLGTYGIYCTKAVNTVQASRSSQLTAGIAKVSELIKINPFDGRPGLYVFSHCENTIKEFGLYRWEEKNIDKNQREVPHKENDHAMDALRYFVNSYNIVQNPQLKRPTPIYKSSNSITGY